MGELYGYLGLSTGVITLRIIHISLTLTTRTMITKTGGMKRLKPCTRQEAYNADITYGTNNEFGFDYLRDNMVRETDQLRRQRELNFAIVDEVDSILIDEARTPLIISCTINCQRYLIPAIC